MVPDNTTKNPPNSLPYPDTKKPPTTIPNITVKFKKENTSNPKLVFTLTNDHHLLCLIVLNILCGNTTTRNNYDYLKQIILHISTTLGGPTPDTPLDTLYTYDEICTDIAIVVTQSLAIFTNTIYEIIYESTKSILLGNPLYFEPHTLSPNKKPYKHGEKKRKRCRRRQRNRPIFSPHSVQRREIHIKPASSPLPTIQSTSMISTPSPIKDTTTGIIDATCTPPTTPPPFKTQPMHNNNQHSLTEPTTLEPYMQLSPSVDRIKTLPPSTTENSRCKNTTSTTTTKSQTPPLEEVNTTPTLATNSTTTTVDTSRTKNNLPNFISNTIKITNKNIITVEPSLSQATADSITIANICTTNNLPSLSQPTADFTTTTDNITTSKIINTNILPALSQPTDDSTTTIAEISTINNLPIPRQPIDDSTTDIDNITTSKLTPFSQTTDVLTKTSSSLRQPTADSTTTTDNTTTPKKINNTNNLPTPRQPIDDTSTRYRH